MTKKSLADGSPFGPRVSPSWASRSAKNCGSTRTVRRVTVWADRSRLSRCVRRLCDAHVQSTGRDLRRIGDEPRTDHLVALVGAQRLELRRCPNPIDIHTSTLVAVTDTAAEASQPFGGDVDLPDRPMLHI